MEILTKEILMIGSYSLTISTVTKVVIIFGLGYLLHTLIKKLINKRLSKSHGRGKSIIQISSYIIFIITTLFALQSIGINITVFLASFTAISVAIGFGLQTIFQDFVSGIILLFDGSISIGHVLEIDSELYKVRKIGLRSSVLESVAGVSRLVPNSKLITDSINNLSYNNDITTFTVSIGVAYDSDIPLVEKLLINAAKEIDGINKNNLSVRLVDFADSSIKLELYFDVNDFMRANRIKSDIRKIVLKTLRTNSIEIPFPQRVITTKQE